ncbi:MAG: flagellar biosynthesis anti-sigma factor FlgM [Pseudomonadota bacterium]
MKIGLPPEISTATPDAAARGKPATKATAGAATQGVDRVDLSAAGARIGAPNTTVDFDSAKVEAIKEAIKQGRFNVNPEVISDRLIAEASALLRPRAS